jgi:hypothetical protein
MLPELGESFGAHIDGAAYETLVAEADTPEALEKLAAYLDEMTRTVIAYIDRNAEKIKIG